MSWEIKDRIEGLSSGARIVYSLFRVDVIDFVTKAFHIRVHGTKLSIPSDPDNAGKKEKPTATEVGQDIHSFIVKTPITGIW